MTAQVIVTADDFGLSRGITDTILEAADRGAVRRVSIIANGLAVDYALREYEKRKERLELSLHLNLTEGKAISPRSALSHLTSPDGSFRNSPLGILLISFIPWFRRALRSEVRSEIEAQLDRVRSVVGKEVTLAVDGHQHIQMVPLIFAELVHLCVEGRFKSIRLSREPFFFAQEFPFTYLGYEFARHFVLNVLARFNAPRADSAGILHPDYFIGTLLSGSLTHNAIENALSEIVRLEGRFVEIGIHPGSALRGELDSWKGTAGWHYSPWRKRERELLQSQSFSILLSSFSQGTLKRGSRVLEVGRFVIAGSLATLTNLGLLYAFTEFTGLWYIFSAILAYVFSIGMGFTLHKFWTFSHYSLKRTRREVTFFILNNLLGIVFNITGLYLLVEYTGMWYVGAQFVLLIMIATWNFFMYRFFIFPRTARP